MRKTKLELTWIGKDKRPKLDPRILLENPELSYHASHKVSENDIFDNKLIFAMYRATELASRPGVKVESGSSEIDPALQHEKMLRMRLFGAKKKQIAKALPDTLVGVKHPKAEVHRRTKHVANFLGFFPRAGDDTA